MGRREVTDYIELNPLIKRKIARDVLPERITEASIAKLGLLPGSESGNDIERHASRMRLNKIAPIWNVVQLLSDMAGEVAGRAILESLGYDFQIADDDPDLAQYKKLVQAAVPAVIANLIELGMLRMGAGVE